MEKTNVKSVDKYNSESYPELGVYENTDETNMVEIMIPDKSHNIVHAFMPSQYIMIERAVEAMINKDKALDRVASPITFVPEPEKTVSEDFALKMMALVVNKEKIKEVQ